MAKLFDSYPSLEDDMIILRRMREVDAPALKDYLMNQVKVRTITAHVMPENRASAKALVNNGFINLYSSVPEDWGFPGPTPTDKYVFKSRWISGAL